MSGTSLPDFFHYFLQILKNLPIISMRTIYQQQEKGCGYASIKMLLVALSGKKNFRYIVEPDSSSGAPNLVALTSWAAKYGLCITSFKSTYKSQLLRNKEFPILIIINSNGDSHLVMLYKRIGNSFLVFDPMKGKRLIKCKELVKQFSGVYIRGNYVENGVEIKKKSIGFLKPKIFQIFLELFSFISIFIGFYFISDEGNFLSPLILFCLFVLLKIFQRISLEKTLIKFDKKYSNKIDAISKPKRESIYKFFLNFKINYFSGPLCVFSNLIEIILLSIILCLNSVYYGIGLLVSLCISVALFLFGKNKKEKCAEEIEYLEAQYLGKVENKNEIKACDILNKTYSFVKRDSYKEIVFVFIDLVICLLICLFSQIVSLNFMLFSLMTLIYIQNRLDTILNKLEALKSYQRDKARFVGFFLRK